MTLFDGRNDPVHLPEMDDPARSRRLADAPPDASLTDALRLYLRDIHQYPLLTREDEVLLGTWIAEARAEEQQPERTRNQEVIQRGQQATRRLVEANTRLVVNIAIRYHPHTLTLLDLIQEGNLGLLRAIKRFDVRRGYKFSTYAVWWVKQAISRAMADKDRTIRLPVHTIDTLRQITTVSVLLVQEHGREPTVAEIATALDMDIQRVRFLLAQADPLSLDEPLGKDEEESWTRGDVLPDRQADTAEAATRQIAREQVHHLLQELSPREQRILVLRFGLEDDRCRTLAEVSQEFHLTRERIRQIEQQALRKLSQHQEMQALAPQQAKAGPRVQEPTAGLHQPPVSERRGHHVSETHEQAAPDDTQG